MGNVRNHIDVRLVTRWDRTYGGNDRETKLS